MKQLSQNVQQLQDKMLPDVVLYCRINNNNNQELWLLSRLLLFANLHNPPTKISTEFSH